MGTEQQQEFKSEKRRTGSPIKTVLFTDHSIESWRPKKDRDRLCFARSNIKELVADPEWMKQAELEWQEKQKKNEETELEEAPF